MVKQLLLLYQLYMLFVDFELERDEGRWCSKVETEVTEAVVNVQL